MQRVLRLKLLAIVGVAAAGLAIILIADGIVQRRVDDRIAAIRVHHIPKIGLAGKLDAGFERVSRRLRDAAEAADAEGLDDAARLKGALLAELEAVRNVTDAETLVATRTAIDDYYATAEDVTRRMIRGESTDALVDKIQNMQTKQARASALLAQVGALDEKGLTTAFAEAARLQTTGARIKVGIMLACIALVLGLSLLISRALYRSLTALEAGFRRFGEGDFAATIPAGNDELGSVANSANQMAARLQKLGEERDRSDWLKTGQAGVATELQGELEPEEAANRALAFLSRFLGAPVGVVFYAGPDGVYRGLGSYGLSDASVGDRRFSIGEGLIGEAARRTDITVVSAPAGHLPVRSGLTDGDPRTLVLVPLVHAGKVRGVIELGLVSEWKPEHAELMHAVRDPVTIAIEVARGRAATRALLAETQRQAAELLEARRGLEQKAEEIARASTFKSQFLANMSHELRTPLNAILGFAELMHDGAVPADSPQHKEFLGDILTSGRHLLQLINDVLDLSKVEAGKLEFQPEPIKLLKIVGEVIGILRTTAATARVRVETDLDPAVDSLVLDPARLKQVLYNYASNAIKFTGEGGRVTIRARPEGDTAMRLEVEDTGIGIREDQLPQLFGEFQQLVGDGKKRGGTGLGLALTKRLVEAQGGTVGVRSVAGKGSTFHAILPRSHRSAPATIPPPMSQSGGPSILVIEDNSRDQRDLVAALAGAGYAVEVAATGREALARSRDHAFDAITLDLLLPDMTGLDVLRQIRADGPNRDVPIIVITVVAEPGATAGFAVHDILPKPIGTEQLVASLTRAGVPAHDGVVLLVDDDPGALKIMASSLQQLGYRTQCESDGAAALRAARGSPPAAIVLDLLMPGMSGFEFLDQLRRDSVGRRVPVIVWTAKDLTVDERAILRASANAVVAKGSRDGSAVLDELAALLPQRAAQA